MRSRGRRAAARHGAIAALTSVLLLAPATPAAAQPTIDSFSPASGPVGTAVTIAGSGFTGATAVRFGGVDAGFTVDSDVQITATVPEGATTGPIEVDTPEGTATSAESFTVEPPPPPVPVIDSFSPAAGPEGAEVTIAGSAFTGATAVRFGAVDAGFTLDSDVQITATVPEGATTGPIEVDTPEGTATSAESFTVEPPPPPVPVIDSFSPAAGPEGAEVTIAGSGFTGTTEVRFGGVAATGFTLESDVQITATVPIGAQSGPIEVDTPEGTATSTESFTVQPNILLIVTDDQRWDTLWAMPTVQSELIGRGVQFTNGFAVNPLCCPARVSILTGKYSHSSGIYSNRPPYGGFEVWTGDSSTIATWMDAAGYRTALIGKYMNGYQDTTYIPPGWDRWFATWKESAYFDYFANDQGTIVPYGSAETDYGTDVAALEAEEFVRTADPSEPLFLYFAPHAPHGPAIPAPAHATAFSDLAAWRPPSYNEADLSDKPEYVGRALSWDATRSASVDAFRIDQYRTLLSVDEGIGRILDALADTGRLGNTLILYTSDNGFMWGEHRRFGKLVPYEESIRVPFVVRWDRLASTPRTDARLALHIDLAPTIAQAAGVAAPGVDGRSLLGLLQGTTTKWRYYFGVEQAGTVTDTNGAGVPAYCAIRNARQLFVHYATGEEEFYTLGTDAYQLKNKIGVAKWQATIGKMRDQARALCNPLPPGMPAF